MTTLPKNPDLTIPIILLHGYPFDKSMWDPQLEAMSGSYRMLPYDIHGFGAAAFNEAFITSVFHKDTLETKKDLVDGIRRVVFANSDSAIIRGLSALAERTETCAGLPSIRIPTLIICGRDDAVTPLTQSEMMHTEIHDSVLRVIDGAGHLSNLAANGVQHPSARISDGVEGVGRGARWGVERCVSGSVGAGRFGWIEGDNRSASCELTINQVSY